MSERQIEILEGEGFTIVYNSLIQDSRLRLATRAVLILMLSKPKSWDFSVRGMASIAGVSKDTMSKMLDELAEAGYLCRKQQGRTRGRFDKGGYIVSGRPVFLADKPEESEKAADVHQQSVCGGESAPCPNFSYAKESYAKNSPQENKEQSNTKQDNPPIVPPGVTKAVREQGFAPQLEDAVLRWMQYKQERREQYKPTGLKTLLGRIKSKSREFGAAAVADAIDMTMAANWQGIVWDKLKRAAPQEPVRRKLE